MERITNTRSNIYNGGNNGADEAFDYDTTRQYNRIKINFTINDMKCGTLNEAQKLRTSRKEKIIMKANGKEIIL